MLNNKGIPTIGVRGIQFRSRIEAQWAYIFEKFKWEWEYEPIDLDGYIPDFIINFENNFENNFQKNVILIEIKGDTNIWENYEEHKNKILKSGWNKTFAILGANYKISEYWDNNNCPIIGKVFYLYENKWISDDLIIRKETEDSKWDSPKKHIWNFGGNDIIYDICSGYWKDTIETDTDFSKLWIEAKNKVQWKGKQN